MRLSNIISLSNMIRFNDIMRLSNAIRLRARQQGENLRLLSYYKRVMVINKWLPFEAAIGQKNKVLFYSWERLYIYNISGHDITAHSVKRFNTRMILYKNRF